MLGNIFVVSFFYVTLSILFKFVFCHGLPKGGGGGLLGSKYLGTNVFRTLMCIVCKP